MPGPDGLLTADEQKKLADWVNQKGKNHACPVCSQNNWNIVPHLLNGAIFTPGGALIIGGQSYPLALIACNNCFHVRHFLALPIGIGADHAEVSNGG